MFDIGWQELFLIAVLALIVVGPKDLPHAIRTITTWIRKARMMARDFQAGVNEMVREAELDDVKKHFTEQKDLKKIIADTVDPDGEISKGLVIEEPDLGKSAKAADAGDKDEAGTPEQFEVLNKPQDEDVMPLPTAKAESKTETQS